MTLDDKIARAKDLIEKREQLDEELNTLFGDIQQERQAKRGRPRKEQPNGSGNERTLETPHANGGDFATDSTT